MKNKRTKVLKDANKYEVQEEVMSFKGTFVVAGTRKGTIDGIIWMPRHMKKKSLKRNMLLLNHI